MTKKKKCNKLTPGDDHFQDGASILAQQVDLVNDDEPNSLLPIA